MNRAIIDKLLIGAGIGVMVVMIAGGVLAVWGENFSTSQVQSQLTQEKIYFPVAGSAALTPAEFPTLQQYAGSQVDSGDKAKAYADDFIWHHMMKASGNKTYSEVSALSMASPQDAKLTALKSTLFQGDMLRSSLLTAYAFSRFGFIAHWAAIACFGGAALVLVLVLLGVAHLAVPKPRHSR
jgi:hypothetical protein